MLKNIFEKDLNKICRLSNNASFDTFYVAIGHLFELHWIFEDSVKSDTLMFLMQTRFFSDLVMFIVAQIID